MQMCSKLKRWGANMRGGEIHVLWNINGHNDNWKTRPFIKLKNSIISATKKFLLWGWLSKFRHINVRILTAAVRGVTGKTSQKFTVRDEQMRGFSRCNNRMRWNAHLLMASHRKERVTMDKKNALDWTECKSWRQTCLWSIFGQVPRVIKRNHGKFTWLSWAWCG